MMTSVAVITLRVYESMHISIQFLFVSKNKFPQISCPGGKILQTIVTTLGTF